MNEENYVKGACTNCGTHFEFPESAAGEIIPCPHCKLKTKLIPERDEPAEEGETAAPEPAVKRPNVPLLAIGGVAVLVIVCIGVVLFMKRGGQSAATPTPSKPDVVTSNSLPPRSLPTNTTPASNAPPPVPAVKAPKSLSDLKVGTIQFEKTKGSSLVYAVGTLRNESDYQRFGVTLELDLLNKDGKKVGTAKDYKDVLEPRKDWQFHALVVVPKAVSATVSSIRED
jgi:DNA-directed RNA polymerase subunit RPC12/RpoP